MCELFDQYVRQGRKEGIEQGLQQGIQQGIQALIATCKDFNATFETAAAKLKEKFHLDDAEVERNMSLYW